MFVIAETKLDDSFSNNLFTAEGYKMERRDRNAHGGGIMTFVRADLPFKRRKDLMCKTLECICFELNLGRRKWAILCVYRQPSMKDTELENFITTCLDKIYIHFENVICIWRFKLRCS